MGPTPFNRSRSSSPHSRSKICRRSSGPNLGISSKNLGFAHGETLSPCPCWRKFASSSTRFGLTDSSTVAVGFEDCRFEMCSSLRSECWRAEVERRNGRERLSECSPQQNVAQPSFKRKRNADSRFDNPSATSATAMKRFGHVERGIGATSDR